MKPVNDNKLRIKISSMEDLKKYLDAVEQDYLINGMRKKKMKTKALTPTELHKQLTSLINIEPCS